MAKAQFTSPANLGGDADFRATGLALSNALTAVGVLKTPDTGQIDWSTVARPASNAVIAGYEIRVLSTPAGNPVYIKLEFTVGAAVTVFAVKITVGTGTNGAGGLTGNVSSTLTAQPSGAPSSGVTGTSFVSGDSSRVSVAMFVTLSSGSSNVQAVWSVGRTKDDNGNDTADGVNLVVAAASKSQQYLPKAGAGAVYPASPMSNLQCAAPPSGSATYGTDTGVFPVLINLGPPQNPDMGVAVYMTNDFSNAGAPIPVTMYGRAWDFLTVPNVGGSVNGNTDTRVAIRYE